jgi:formylglycine-generating enzyme
MMKYLHSRVFFLFSFVFLIGCKTLYNIDSDNEMVTIFSGWFKMGCVSKDKECYHAEKPQQKVYLDEFKIDKKLVSVGEYQKCIEAGVCNNNDEKKEQFLKIDDLKSCNLGASGKETHPMNCVSWYGAKAYCSWVGKRLPTNAEWEKAARGGTETIYPCGNNYKCLNETAWYEKNSKGTTKPIGEKAPNGFKIYDMSGNVWEWVNDYDSGSFQKSTSINPKGPEVGGIIDSRIIRGGSFNNFDNALRSSARSSNFPGSRSSDIGFRCVK